MNWSRYTHLQKNQWILCDALCSWRCRPFVYRDNWNLPIFVVDLEASDHQSTYLKPWPSTWCCHSKFGEDWFEEYYHELSNNHFAHVLISETNEIFCNFYIGPRRGCYKFYRGIFFYFCQFIRSFWSLHSFWEEEDLSRKINTSFTEWHHHHIMVILVSESSSQQCSGLLLKLLCLFSSILVHYKAFTMYLIIKYQINVKLITSSHKIQTKTFTWPNMSFYAR